MAHLCLSLLVCLLVIVSANDKCKNWLINLKDKEKALLGDANAMRNLEETFYPVNEHSSLIVEINYLLFPLYGDYDYEEVQANEHSTRKNEANRLQGHNILKRQISSLNRAVNKNASNDPFTFRWMNSPTYLFINQELLRSLSLYTYSYSSQAPPAVTLNFSVPCTWSELQEFIPTSKHGCPNGYHDLVLKAFNNYTSIVSFVAS